MRRTCAGSLRRLCSTTVAALRPIKWAETTTGDRGAQVASSVHVSPTRPMHVNLLTNVPTRGVRSRGVTKFLGLRPGHLKNDSQVTPTGRRMGAPAVSQRPARGLVPRCVHLHGNPATQEPSLPAAPPGARVAGAVGACLAPASTPALGGHDLPCCARRNGVSAAAVGSALGCIGRPDWCRTGGGNGVPLAAGGLSAGRLGRPESCWRRCGARRDQYFPFVDHWEVALPPAGVPARGLYTLG